MIKLELMKLGYKVERKILPKPIQDAFTAKGGQKNTDALLGTKTCPTSSLTQTVSSTPATCVNA